MSRRWRSREPARASSEPCAEVQEGRSYARTVLQICSGPTVGPCMTARSLPRSWPATPPGSLPPTTGTRPRCIPTAERCWPSLPTPPTRCRTPSSSRPPSWTGCATPTGSGRGSTRWRGTSVTGGAGARKGCHRRLRARARTVDLDEAGEMTDDASADVGRAAERADLRNLVRSAIAGLNPGEREVIELSLGHDLEGPDLADALGVPASQAHALASRARGQLERSLGALLVARSGREDCPELNEILASWDGDLTVLLRKRVSRHIEQCDVCGERKRRELSPAMLLGALPVFMLPPGLREQVLRLVSDPRPQAARYREHVAHQAEPFGGSGFPVSVAPLARLRPRGRTIAFATVAALLLILVGGVAAAAMLRHGGGKAQAAGA